MKLLFCSDCWDVIKLDLDELRFCKCKKVSGKYVDNLFAVYTGDAAVPLGFRNPSLESAIRFQPESGMGRDFIAFVIAKECPTFRRLGKNEEFSATEKTEISFGPGWIKHRT